MRKNQGFYLVPPQGDEHNTKSPGETHVSVVGGNAGGNIPCDLAELVALWPKLDADVRNECLELARRGTVELR